MKNVELIAYVERESEIVTTDRSGNQVGCIQRQGSWGGMLRCFFYAVDLA